MKTNPQILESVLGWPEGSIEKTVIKPAIPLKTVYAALDAVRAEYEPPVPRELTPEDFERVLNKQGTCEGCYFLGKNCAFNKLREMVEKNLGSCNNHIFKLKSEK